MEAKDGILPILPLVTFTNGMCGEGKNVHITSTIHLGDVLLGLSFGF